MELKLTILDGEYCGPCPMLRDFKYEEIGKDESERNKCVEFPRRLVAACCFFNEKLTGETKLSMKKCPKCLNYK